jgi:hypothetical protein
MQHSSLDEDEEDFPGLLLHQVSLFNFIVPETFVCEPFSPLIHT